MRIIAGREAFNFDYCDVLAGKAQVFYDLGETGLKADMAVAMLILGLDHNRWFVERKFLQMASPATPEAVVQRMIVEMSVQAIDFDYQFRRMGNSISIDKEVLHPLLQALISDAG